MEKLKDKTPSSSFRDILNIGENQEGLNNFLSPITDGFGVKTGISSSLHSTDIEFNGGSLSSCFFNTYCNKYVVHPIPFNSINYINVGHCETEVYYGVFNNIIDPYDSLDPYMNEYPPEHVVIRDDRYIYVTFTNEEGVNLDCKQTDFILRTPLNYKEGTLVYSCTNLYLKHHHTYITLCRFYTEDGTSINVRDSIDSEYSLKDIYPYLVYSDGDGEGFDHLKIEFIKDSNNEISNCFYITPMFKEIDVSTGSMIANNITHDPELHCPKLQYQNKGEKMLKTAPLSKSTPGGSSRDILSLRNIEGNANQGLIDNLVEIVDGNDKSINIQVSKSQVEVNCNNGELIDPIFGSKAKYLYELILPDSNENLIVSGKNIDHIFLNRVANSSDNFTYNIDIDMDELPSSDLSISNMKNMLTFTFSYFCNNYSIASASTVFLRFGINSKYKIVESFEIPEGAKTEIDIAKFLVIYSDKVEEVIKI